MAYQLSSKKVFARVNSGSINLNRFVMKMIQLFTNLLLKKISFAYSIKEISALSRYQTSADRSSKPRCSIKANRHVQFQGSVALGNARGPVE